MVRTLSIVPLLAIGCSYSEVDVPYDVDGDGLMGDEEAEYGTNPDKADTDGDSYDDGTEVAGNTDPTNRGDHPYEGGWPIDACRWDIEDGSVRVGDIAPDFELEDQFGETVRLHDFCGKAVLVTVGAEWCGPCQAKASKLEALYQQYDPSQFIAIDVLYQNMDGQPATAETAQEWVDAYGLTVPVLIDPDAKMVMSWVLAGYIPSESLMKPGMEIFVLDTQDADLHIDEVL
jgi:peroxiredoxin